MAEKTPFFTRTLAITDIETTGLDPKWHEIIEIGLVLVRQDTLEVIGELDLKVRPEHIDRAEPEALRVNGYRPEDWSEAVALHPALIRYATMTAGAALVAHNAAFERSFLEAAFRRHKVRHALGHHHLDTMPLAWLALRDKGGLESFKLAVVAKRLGVEPEPAVHRAIEGARLAHRVLKAICGKR